MKGVRVDIAGDLCRGSLLIGLLLATSLFHTGCSYLNRQDPDLNLPEPRVSTTGAGAITGAAVGAGLGLAIGASSGNAGEGLAVGTVAGAAAGAVIGNVIEKQENKKRQQIVRDQDSVIEEQQIEINELKKTREDKNSSTRSKSLSSSSSSKSTKASSRAMLSRNYKQKNASSYLKEGYKGNPRAVRFSSTDVDPRAEKTKLVAKTETKAQTKNLPAANQIASKKTETKLTELSSDKAKLASKEASAPKTIAAASSKTQHVAEALAAEKEKAREVVQMPSSSELPPAREVASNTATGTIGSAVAEEADEAVAEAAKPVEKAVTTTTAAVETLPKAVESAAKKAPSDPACANAEQEAIRARNSSSDADRLFYLRRAARLCPSFAGYHVEIGQIYTQLGRKEDARFALTKALELDPDNASAKERLNILNQ